MLDLLYRAIDQSDSGSIDWESFQRVLKAERGARAAVAAAGMPFRPQLTEAEMKWSCDPSPYGAPVRDPSGKPREPGSTDRH